MSERFIQAAVARGLNRRHYRRRSAYVATEAYTKLKRADVLLAFMRTRGRPYVVVVEAKSRTTIHQLKLRTDDLRVRWVGRVISLLLVGGTLTLLGYQWYISAISTLVAGALFLLTAVGITALVRQLDLRWTRAIAAIRQLARYPANESWIAVGEDTFVRPEELNTLRRQCRKGGIGLIIVGANGRLRLDKLPAPRHAFNDYLSRYGRREEILEAIGRRPEYGPTPGERRQNRQRFLRIGLLLVFVGLLLLVGYERSNGPVVPDPFTTTAFRNDPDFTEPRSTGEDCATARGEAGRFVVADTIVGRDAVAVRLAELRASGLSGMEVFPATCVEGGGGADRRVIANGGRYADAEEARRAASAYRKLLVRLGQRDRSVRILMLVAD